ncbi:hypothetical protein Cob_v011714 [Colletotrichum orbiculare MAFF 240422]|uniref:Uncharacterized protein n=1 Tax=Colletotrichum orbiculare (strain 104-T / ATCC 96160 / CBS 514.97 / LARS 414 / MAFF 240422) TaxID=1213857 RepID=A0A484FBN3_COLOR|nr:hypothetical protein Cob_v011714 [Colletotrichum orbiculare MAFF 240422]
MRQRKPAAYGWCGQLFPARRQARLLSAASSLWRSVRSWLQWYLTQAASDIEVDGSVFHILAILASTLVVFSLPSVRRCAFATTYCVLIQLPQAGCTHDYKQEKRKSWQLTRIRVKIQPQRHKLLVLHWHPRCHWIDLNPSARPSSVV